MGPHTAPGLPPPTQQSLGLLPWGQVTPQCPPVVLQQRPREEQGALGPRQRVPSSGRVERSLPFTCLTGVCPCVRPSRPQWTSRSETPVAGQE